MALHKETEICQKISSEVKNTFLQVYNAVKERETQLLRQIEVLVQHCKTNNSYEKCFKQISVVFDNELDILLSISKFGRINFNGLSQESNFFKIEDYQHPDKDHVSLFKCVSMDNKECQNDSSNVNDMKIKNPIENIIEHNMLSEDEEKVKTNEKEKVEEKKYEYTTSNVMLECIEKQDPSLCLYELADKKKVSEVMLSEDQELFSSCCSSPNEVNKVSKYFDTLNELHQDICNSIHNISNSTSVPNLTCMCNDSISKNCCSQQEIHIKDNISTNSAEELRNATERVRKLSMKQPVQVQQWMKQIISEPETEPAHNSVMEHSQIKVFHKESP